ncbi:DMT family transporter [Alphaproteobacteria bacterium KMM 3653]|uniref:DMT family transporter n=1 Tax=Harenicola maris TaxID=2841044 RepID=A0AAP2G3G5_9RHOB|nr:DMT family transporter [Harenicola maris]
MSPILRGALWMIGAIIAFPTMAVAGREISAMHDTFEIMLFRSIFGIMVVLSIGGISGTLGQINTRHMPLHVLRNAAHFAGQNLWFYALTVIPLAQVFALEFTSPIWVMALAPLFLGERFTRWRAFAGVMGIAGVLVVVRPDVDSINPGVIAAALAAIGFAGTAICTKILTKEHSITCILFWLTVLQAIFGLICAGYDGQVTWPSLASAPWLAVIGMAGLLGHFCLTKALSAAPASIVMPIDFARLPVIVGIGMILYNEPFDVLVIFGGVMIFLGNYLNIRAESRS